MNLPDLSNGPPDCAGEKIVKKMFFFKKRTPCANKGWIGTKQGFLCSDCFGQYNQYKQKQLLAEAVREHEEIFR